MADPERFKRQSPDSPAVKCKRLRSDFGEATEKKETATGLVKTRIHIGKTLHVVTRC